MTSKEAYNLFEKVIEESGIEITFELSKARATLMQSLDRLEELEKEYTNLKQDYNNKDFECIDLYKENQELRAKADKYDELCKHNVMDNQEFGNELIVAILNQSKRVNDRNKELRLENTKLKKAIEILKCIYDIQYIMELGNGNYGIVNMVGDYIVVEEEKAIVLKEVLK